MTHINITWTPTDDGGLKYATNMDNVTRPHLLDAMQAIVSVYLAGPDGDPKDHTDTADTITERVREMMNHPAQEPAGLPLRVTVTHPELAPTRATTGAAGYDLRSAHDYSLKPGERITINTGVAMSIPTGHVGILTSRSGHGKKHGITLANSVGIIDSDYRGKIGVTLTNHGTEHITISRGDRIAQISIMPLTDVDLTIVDTLDTTDRGTGGFGSTGDK